MIVLSERTLYGTGKFTETQVTGNNIYLGYTANFLLGERCPIALTYHTLLFYAQGSASEEASKGISSVGAAGAKVVGVTEYSCTFSAENSVVRVLPCPWA